MGGKIFVWLLPTLFLGTVSLADAQQTKKIPRIGFLSLTPGPSPTSSEAFQQGLHELGYVEGKNIAIEYRYAAGRLDRLPEMAAELVRLNVDVIVTAATPPSQAAQNATKTIPIVMAAVGDPVATGLVASLAKPGGNITGQTIFSSELTGKRLDLLKEVVPRVTRIGVLAYGPTPFTAHFLRETEAAAQALGLKLRSLEVLDPREFGNAFAAIIRERAGALLVQQNPLFLEHRQRIVELAAKSHLPAMYEIVDWVEAGGLVAYGVHLPDLYRRAAVYVDKILKGRNPADLPVEQPTKFELVMNLKAAKQIGLTIPPNVLARADKVIR
jgi:putative ABC transport system substrate-binding protein